MSCQALGDVRLSAEMTDQQGSGFEVMGESSGQCFFSLFFPLFGFGVHLFSGEVNQAGYGVGHMVFLDAIIHFREQSHQCDFAVDDALFHRP